MNSAIAVAIGLSIAIYLIYKKCLPVYALILGTLVSGILSGAGPSAARILLPCLNGRGRHEFQGPSQAYSMRIIIKTIMLPLLQTK